MRRLKIKDKTMEADQVFELSSFIFITAAHAAQKACSTRRHVGAGERQPDAERRADAGRAVDVDRAAEQRDQAAHDVQAEADAAVAAGHRAVGLAEGLEDDRQRLGRDADAGVGDARSRRRRRRRARADA